MTAFVHSTVHSVWATFSTRTGILVGAVPSSSSNPDPISDQKMLFSTPVSDLAFRDKLYYHYSDWSANKNNYSDPFEIRIFLFLSYSLGIETINTFIHTVVPSKTIRDSRPKWAKCIPVSDQNGAKTLPDREAHTYIAYMREYPPSPPSGKISKCP